MKLAMGDHVSKLKVGDFAGVGCMIDSCWVCSVCKEDLEQYCDEGATWTYNGYERNGGAPTYSGSSCAIPR